MRGYVLTRYGGPEAMELRDLPEPQPGPGDVRIRVAAAGLNPVDFKIRQGALRPISPFRLPVVVGCEVAGTVDAVGPGPSRFAVGTVSTLAWTNAGWVPSPSSCACSRNSLPPCRRRLGSPRRPDFRWPG
ncbi:alcohol dehydrogenase catalytic domain-containing protein [Arthrobacter sp. OVS8]|nr:alcohol dehydrogenase catalytic domain-containing protein [Arthrobacter sp. OVS8]